MTRLLAIAFALFAVSTAQAQQKTTAQIKNDITTLFPTTGAGLITANRLREVTNEIADSYANKGGDTFNGNVNTTGAFQINGTNILAFTQSGTGAVARTVDAKLKDAALSVTDFGAKCDAYISGNPGYTGQDSGSISNGSSTFTAVNATFSSADIGKKISIEGASSGGQNILNATITAGSGHTATLDTAATVTVTGKAFTYATDDTTAIQNAINWASFDAQTRRLIIPPVVCGVGGGGLTVTTSNVQIEGSQAGNLPRTNAGSSAKPASGFAWVGGPFQTLLTVQPAAGAANLSLQGIKVRGIGIALNNVGSDGVLINATSHSEFSGLSCEESLNRCIIVGATSPITLADYCGEQFNTFAGLSVSQDRSSGGVPLSIFGNSTCNASLNNYFNIDISHSSIIGVYLAGVDNEHFYNTRVAGFGLASQSVNITTGGGYVSNNNWFYNLSANFAPYMDLNTYDNHFTLDSGNGTPNPTLNGNATAYWDGITGQSLAVGKSYQINGANALSVSKLSIPTNTTPASATAACTKGDIVWDSGFVYVCTATNTWKRAAIATW